MENYGKSRNEKKIEHTENIKLFPTSHKTHLNGAHHKTLMNSLITLSWIQNLK